VTGNAGFVAANCNGELQLQLLKRKTEQPQNSARTVMRPD
jgi:hypothetical protein